METPDFFQCIEQQNSSSRKRTKNFCILIVSLSIIHFLLLGIGIYFQIKINKEHTQHFVTLNEKIHDLELSIAQQKEFIESENRIIKEQILSSSEYLEDVTRTQITRAINTIIVTNRHVGQIEKVYGDLLEELKKKTLESLYDEEALTQRLQTARKLFEEGKYRQAYNEYEFVAKEQPENLEVEFYKYYSLFLRNKGDRNQYREIRNGLSGLENRGYTRKEIQEVLAFIAAEEGIK